MLLFLWACNDDEPTPQPMPFQIISVSVGPISLSADEVTTGVPVDQPVVFRFSVPVDLSNIEDALLVLDTGGNPLGLTYFPLDEQRTISARPDTDLAQDTEYTAVVSNALRGVDGEQVSRVEFDFRTFKEALTLTEARIGEQSLLASGRMTDVPLDFTIDLTFSHPVDAQELLDNTTLFFSGGTLFDLAVTPSSGTATSLTLSFEGTSEYLRLHRFNIKPTLESVTQNVFAGYQRDFYTAIDETPKFPVIPDDELLTRVQEQTFRYFWDFGHEVSGLSRERNTSGNLVTSGGSGFGLMTIPIGIERGFITREEGVQRIATIVDFLRTADRFHGAWSHWLNGTTGEVINFSSMDNGGDIVETSYMAMGLLTVRQYLNENDPAEQEIRDSINSLWHAIEWDWYTKDGTEDALYWHWSPEFEWAINHRISGYNETLITYIMAASSPTHPIDPEAYHSGFARNGGIVNGNEYYGITLPLGPSFGGPLFFSHYTYLGIDPRNLEDQYANYWELGVNHSLINREHCIINPAGYVAYSDRCWGLTASDGNNGYSAHSPTNDRGVITPTAALSAMPYVPEHSMDALKFFYYTVGDRLWGEHGFYDAFNFTAGWVASSYLAIDQGPIIIMIENHRTGMIWDLFMSCPEVQEGLTRLGFTY